MEEGNLAILVDAKTEYTKQLVAIISPHIYNGIKGIYFEAKEECFEKDEMVNTLREFQLKLSKIPKWNQEVINEECELIIRESKCDSKIRSTIAKRYALYVSSNHSIFAVLPDSKRCFVSQCSRVRAAESGVDTG